MYTPIEKFLVNGFTQSQAEFFSALSTAGSLEASLERAALIKSGRG